VPTTVWKILTGQHSQKAMVPRTEKEQSLGKLRQGPRECCHCMFYVCASLQWSREGRNSCHINPTALHNIPPLLHSTSIPHANPPDKGQFIGQAGKPYL
jgi:hypothetical protein